MTLGVSAPADVGASSDGGRARPGQRRPASVLVIDGSTSWARWWADLYLYRGALKSLAWRNVRSRYKQAALGLAWALLQPAVQVAVFTLLFARVARVPSGGVPYPLFALAGLLPWNLFAKVLAEGAPSLVTNQHLITKLFFPRIYLVLASGASALVDAAVTLALLLGGAALYGILPDAGALLALPALLGLVLLSVGTSALLAALNARWRDVQHTLPLLLQVGILVTPVAYPSTVVPAEWRWVVALNPVAGLVEVFRAALLGLPMPEARVVWTSLAVGAAAAAAGVWFFARSEARIVDVV